MSHLRFQMGAGIDSTYGNQLPSIPRQPQKKPHNPNTPIQKPIPKEKVKAEVSDD